MPMPMLSMPMLSMPIPGPLFSVLVDPNVAYLLFILGIIGLVGEFHHPGTLFPGIVGAGAGELIAEGVLAVEMAAVAKDIALTIHPHPTLSETIMESAEVFFGTSTDIYRPKKS